MLDSKAVSLSLAFTSEVLYILCTLFFYLFPEGTLMFFNSWFHGIDLTRIGAPGTIATANFFIGFASIFVVSYLTGTVFAYLYNRLSRYGKG